MQLITPDSFEALAFALNDLLTEQTACITADGYKRLTGDDLSVPITEGRIMIGNLAARTNCTVAITDERVVFTKNPTSDIPQRTSDAKRHLTS
jgi:hypothetical protein